MPCLVQEAACGERVVVLKVRVPGRTAFVIVGATRSGGAAGLLPQGAQKAHWGARLPPGTARQRAREDALEGAEVVALGDAEALLEQRGAPRVVRAQGGRVVVTDVAPGTDLASRGAARALALVLEDDAAREALEQRGAAIAGALATEGLDVHREAVARALDAARRRLDRRREAVRSDLGRIAQADALAAQAQWLVGEAARTPRGATELVVTDWSSGEPVRMVIPLDPSRTAREQVEAMFKRAKRLRLGARIAEDRLRQTEAQLEALGSAAAAVRAAATVTEIDAAAAGAKRAAPRDVTLPQPAAGTSPRTGRDDRATAARGAGGRTPFRTFVATSGTRLLVGKGATDNDALTTKVAKPHDLWVHAKDRTGAHVIVPLEKGHTCKAEDLVDAALLAAHFSDARDEALVDVQYAPRRYVRKPKGSPAGLVLVDREKVLALRVERERLCALLEREDVG